MRRAIVPTEHPEQLPGWCTLDKGAHLLQLARALPAPARCVELGVHGGRSLIAIGLGLKLAGHGNIDGIDSYTQDDCMEGHHSDSELDGHLKQLWSTTDYENLLNRALGAIALYDLSAYVRIVRKKNDDAAADYPDGSINLLHLDANHSEPASCRDVATWLPKMAPASLWVCDDVNWPSMAKALGLLEAAGFKQVKLGDEGYWAVYRRKS